MSVRASKAAPLSPLTGSAIIGELDGAELRVAHPKAATAIGGSRRSERYNSSTQRKTEEAYADVKIREETRGG